MLVFAKIGAYNTKRREMNKRELATVLAALRHYQSITSTSWGRVESVATDGGSFPAMSFREIDSLCEKLNVPATAAPEAVVVIEGGMVSAVITNQKMKVAVVDYDADPLEADSVAQIPQGKGKTAGAACFLLAPEVVPARSKELVGIAAKMAKRQSNGMAL
jgi:hypothetical protein